MILVYNSNVNINVNVQFQTKTLHSYIFKFYSSKLLLITSWPYANVDVNV